MANLPKFQRTAATSTGDVIPGATITVRDQTTGITATLYSNRAGTTALSNPFSTGNDGFIEFFVSPGVYRIEVVGGSGTIEWDFVELNMAQTSITDATENRLMKVGAFGSGIKYGAPLLGGDIDNIDLPSGINYRFDNATAGDVPFAYGTVIMQRINSETGSQLAIQVLGEGMAKRHINNGVWGQWRKIYHAGSILGPVSQSGGVPAGAIIERGSNANGEYTKFADGTLVCWRINISLTFDNSSNLRALASFPSLFISKPLVIPSYDFGVYRTFLLPFHVYQRNTTTATTTIGLASSTGFALGDETGNKIGYTAIGRWY